MNNTHKNTQKHTNNFNFTTHTVADVDITKLINTMRVNWIQDWKNIRVAGGHVVNAIMNDKAFLRSGDIDIFFVVNDEEAKDIVNLMKNKLMDIHAWLFEAYPNSKLHYHKTITGNINIDILNKLCGFTPIRVQVMTTMYFKSTRSILDSFDLNNVQFAWDGSELTYTTDAGKYLVDRVVRPYSEHKSRWLDHRIKKYQRVYNTIEYRSIETLNEVERATVCVRNHWFAKNYVSKPTVGSKQEVELFGPYSVFEILQCIENVKSFCFDDYKLPLVDENASSLVSSSSTLVAENENSTGVEKDINIEEAREWAIEKGCLDVFEYLVKTRTETKAIEYVKAAISDQKSSRLNVLVDPIAKREREDLKFAGYVIKKSREY